MLQNLYRASRKVGLKMNTFRCVHKDNETPHSQWKANYRKCSSWPSCVLYNIYLGHEIRIGRYNQICEYDQFLKAISIPLSLKKAYQVCVEPNIWCRNTYGHHITSKKKLQKLQKERSILNISLRDRIINIEIRNKTKLPDILANIN